MKVIKISEKKKSVFEEITAYVEKLRENKKKTVVKEDVINFLDSIYQDKQTIDVNMDVTPVKFEGLNDQQVECFLKIFEGFRSYVQTSEGSVARHPDVQDGVVNNNGFESVTYASAEKVVNLSPFSTPPVE
jgi:HD-GYP domain-containing protein (c-di-GMP phosphodiesterase class II)